MKRFENGDVLMSENEYRELISTHASNRSYWELGNLFIRHNKFYWELKRKQYELSSVLNFNPNLSSLDYEVIHRIRDSDLKLFQEWSKMINEFEPDRPILD